MNLKTYGFLSDVHLGLEDRERERRKERALVGLLEKLGEEIDELFIVGDLFDYWFEYRRVQPKGYFRTLTALADLVERGVRVRYVIGNHDFFHRDFFEKEVGAELAHDYIDETLNGKRFFIAHGDGYVSGDGGYNFLKKIFRNRVLQWAWSLVHPDAGLALARGASRSSRDYTTKKDYGEADGLFDAAKAKIDAGFDYVVFGHLHQLQNLSHNAGRYVNLGAWLEKPRYGLFRENFSIIDWEDYGG
ncbi:MAG: UDP-2,3-diacylglucosamine diphosphatase [Ignavibacteriales bacterium]|nr:UDP-2,3-diacylglucosamine diphosphatase [Ignavibacteriales bacterium]